ncbi:MAG: hypothetical protein LUI06_10495 [Ruminococcus sp.]|nr:hypothetical protein [Ruminococcus sp.]
MKKIILIFLSCLSIVLCSCGNTDEISSSASDSSTSAVENTAGSGISDSEAEKSYTVIGTRETASAEESDYTWEITDEGTIESIDAWIDEVMKICDEYELSGDDYPERGGVDGYIIKTDGDNEDGFYYVNFISSDYDVTDEYEHENNFSYADSSYDLPYEYIEQIQTIISSETDDSIEAEIS